MLDAAHNVGKAIVPDGESRPGIDESFPKYSNAHQTGWLRSAREGSHWLARGSPFFSRAAAVGSIFLFAMLVSVPCVVLFLTVNPLPDSPHLKLLQLPAVYWAVWALVSLWVALDSAKLFNTLGLPVDPLGSYGIWGLLLGALNVGASLLVLTEHISH
jgi:hypothetical protein